MPDGPSSKPRLPDGLALLALIVLSFAARLPRVGAMDSQYDYLTSHTVLITRVWQMLGLPAAHYSLISNWPNPSDLYAQHGVAALFDERGNTYFLSFPPLAFYLSYGLFQLLGSGASLFPLRLLSLLASAGGAWALYGLVRRAWPAAGSGPPLLAAAVFLLSPVALFYFSMAYFPLILSIPMWMGVTALFARAREADASLATRAACGLGCFALCYTDWLGFLAVFAYALLALRRRDTGLAAIVAIPAAAALALTLLTYASIAGWEPLLAGAREKYLQRSGLKAHQESFAAWNPRAYWAILRNYGLGFAPWVLPLAAAAVAWWTARPEDRQTPAPMRELLFLFSLPVLLDHAGLINHTAMHRYAALKAAPAIGIGLAMLAGSRIGKKPALTAALAAATLGLCLWGYLRLPYRTDAELSAIADHVNYKTQLSDVLFMERNRWMFSADPALLVMMERNLHFVSGRQEAEESLKRMGATRGYFLRLVRQRPPLVEGEVLQAPRVQ